VLSINSIDVLDTSTIFIS